MTRTKILTVTVSLCLAAGLVQCASDRGGDSADLAEGIRGAEAVYAEAEQVQQQITAAGDANAKMTVLNAYRSKLRERAAAHDRAVTEDKVEPAEQKMYDELLGLLLTLNNFPNKAFSPDYCEIIRHSIYVAWAPNEAAPDPEQFPRPAREGLKFLELFCAAP